MLCGGAMPLKKRVSTSIKDEISPMMLERIRPFSRKVQKGQFDVSKCELFQDDSPMATYKDPNYRERITARYGMYTMENELHFLTPYLSKSWKGGKDHDLEPKRTVEQTVGCQEGSSPSSA